jgi:hypothetical protein
MIQNQTENYTENCTVNACKRDEYCSRVSTRKKPIIFRSPDLVASCGSGHFQTYRIADIAASFRGEGQRLREQWADYQVSGDQAPEIIIDISSRHIDQLKKENPDLSADECASAVISSWFYEALFGFEGFRLHASAVVLDGKAYLFSAPSGTGKSTHTSLWLEYFGRDRAHIINDDSPIIRRVGNQYIAYGSPWSGSSNLNMSDSAPIQAIAFIERSQNNWIHPLSEEEAVFCLLNQARRTAVTTRLDNMLSLFGGLIQKVPIYRMGCTMGFSSVSKAYSAMFGMRGEQAYVF